MKKNNTANISSHINREKIVSFIDGILLFIVSAIFFIAIAGYFTRNTTAILIFGIVMSLIVITIIRFFKRNKKPQLTKQAQDAMNQFIFKGYEFTHEFFMSSFSKKYSVSKEKDYLVINNTAVFLRFDAEALSASSLIYIYSTARQNSTIKKVIVLSPYGTAPNSQNLLSGLPLPSVEIFNSEKIYRLLLWLKSLPDIEIIPSVQKTNFKDVARNALKPNCSRRYLFAALILIISSTIMAYSIYYVVVASLCIILAVLSRVDILSVKKR